MSQANDERFSRRDFVKGAAAFTATAGSAAHNASTNGRARSGEQTPQHSADQVPKRPLGKTGVQVSAIGVGGYHLGSTRDQQEANDLVAMALDAGINFFDNAWDYHVKDCVTP